MKNLLHNLKTLLQKDERLVSKGELLKNKIIELALKLDKELIKLLLSDKKMKQVFFADIAGALIFDKDKFLRFVSNKQFLPDSYTAFKNKIGLIAEDEYLSGKKEVVLSWPYKDCVLEGGMTKEDQKRNEIFWNEILAPDEISRLFDPKVFTNAKRIDKKGEHPLRHSRESGNPFRTDKNGDIKDNLIIKGNNLLALHSLKKRFAGKVKLIYIDPPYNTPGDANTFNYNNSFNHSTWLTFMKNRLWVSKDLLRNDGVIAITIDDTEQAYLKILCDEVFDRQNFIGTLVIQSKPGGRTNDTYLATSHEYVLFYSKVKDAPQINFFELSEVQKRKYKHGKGENSYKWRDFLRTGGYSTPEERPNSHYPIYYHPKRNHISLEKLNDEYIEILPIDSSGRKRVWRKIPRSLQKHIEQGEIKILKTKNGEWKVKIIDKIKEGIRPSSVWVESRYDASTHGTKLLKRMFDGKKVFSFPKSIYAVQDVIEMFTERGGDDIVLDYFAGSGTTAHAVMNLNRKDGGNRQFILCEQMSYLEAVTTERVRKIIEENNGGDFVYLELMKWNENFVEKIQKAKTKGELKKLWEIMKKKAFLSYKVEIKMVDENAKDPRSGSGTSFEDLSIEDQKKFLLECLDKNHLYVNYSEIDDEDYGVSERDKRLNRDFYKS